MGLKGLPHPGDILDLTVRWGTNSRTRCPVCNRFVRCAQDIVCLCGAEYQAIGEKYKVVRIRDVHA
jgi:hypothetical protein